MESILVFVSGSSGAGKNSIINGVIASEPDKCKFLVSNTTRPKRESDKKVGQYHFLTKEQFEKKIANGEVLEYDVYNGNYYGLGIDEVQKSAETGKVLLKDLTVKGVLNSKEVLAGKYKQVNVFVTESKRVLRERLVARGENKQNIKNRLKMYVAEQKMSKLYDYLLYNTVLEDSVEKVKTVINTVYEDLPILSNVSTQRVNARRIECVAKKLRNGKTVKPILVEAVDGRLYIVEGLNTYLASINTGIGVTKQFVNKQVDLNLDVNEDEWLRIVDSYKQA